MAGGERRGASWQSRCLGCAGHWDGEGSLHAPLAALARLQLLKRKITATLVFPREPQLGHIGLIKTESRWQWVRERDVNKGVKEIDFKKKSISFSGKSHPPPLADEMLGHV